MENYKIRDNLTVYGSRLSPRMFLDNNGQLIIKDAILARTGEYDYLESDIKENGDKNKIVKVYRTPEEVFDPASIASFENKPMCNDHPDDDVCSDNYKSLQCGFLRDVRRGEGEQDNCLLGTLVVTDPEVIEIIKNKDKRDLSLGYDTQIVIGDDGNYYMTKIRGNHVALVEDGRAGIATIRDNNNIKNLGGLEQVKLKPVNASAVDSFAAKLFDEDDVIEVAEVKDDNLTETEKEVEVPAETEIETEVKDEVGSADLTLDKLSEISEKLSKLIELLTPAPVEEVTEEVAPVEDAAEEKVEITEPAPESVTLPAEETVTEEKEEIVDADNDVVCEEHKEPDEDITVDTEGFYDEAADKDEDDTFTKDSASVYAKFVGNVTDSNSVNTMEEEINEAFRQRYKNIGGKN